MKPTHILLSAISIALATGSFSALAGGKHEGMAMGKHQAMSSQQQVAEAQGTVNSVDAEAKTINISHGPIKAFKWPPMTMDMALQNSAVAKGVQKGDKIRFKLVKLAATEYEIAAIEVVGK